MGAFFTIGERKIRPGVYFRYENWGTPPIAGVDDGRCACVFRSDWGPLGVATLFENFTEIANIYGDGGADGTTIVPLEQFRGGARTVRGVRLGDPSTGTQGRYEILDDLDVPVILLILANPGSRQFDITIRPTLADPDVSELLILQDTRLVERLTFQTPQTPPTDYNMVQALLDAASATRLVNFSLQLITASDEAIAVIDQEPITPGTDPVITGADYTAALEILEAYRWNVLAIDTNDVSIQVLTQMFLNRVLQGGMFVMGVIGQPSSLDFNTRLTQASSYDDYQIVYVGNGYYDITGNANEGYLSAARISGMIAGTPSNDSITRLTITGAINLTEPLSNNSYERAITAGMLTFSTSAANTVWVEKGINTLITIGSQEDAGWKSIKRVKIRFELMQRINDTVEVLVGRINNDDDGRLTIIQLANAVCNMMIAERKLLDGAFSMQDPANPPEGDSAWFIVEADDIEALEKIYFTFRFRFSSDAS